MQRLQGKGVSRGIAIGRLSFSVQLSLTVPFSAIDNVENELVRFETCRLHAIEQLGVLAEQTKESLGEEGAMLFEVHQMMLDDMDFRDAITGSISENKASAEYAVGQAAAQFSEMFSSMDDPYMQARASDVEDISRRLLEGLQGKCAHSPCADGSLGTDGKEPLILAGVDFTPSETAQCDRARVCALVTSAGSQNSHTAIFSRILGIPAIIGLNEELHEGFNGLLAVVNGSTGELLIDPDEATLTLMREKKAQLEQDAQRLEAFRGKKTLTSTGKPIKLYANIGSSIDVDAVVNNDAEGIGLFRSEFLYLESDDYPSEQVQYEAYSHVARKMGDKQVVIRTLDIGADKQASYFNLPHEENPALGMRAIRICLTRPEVFKTQLRALYRAACNGNILIMLPMITGLAEIKRAKALMAEVKAELTAENIPFKGDIPVGIMIETPAAAIMSDVLAQEVDFFSMGTNDLTQYTLAIDRQNESIAEFCDIHDEAILRLIEMVCTNAHKHGIWAGICGELAADTQLTEFFVKVGVDELSVSPADILPLREKISLI